MFYEMLDCLSDEEKLLYGLQSASKYFYLNQVCFSELIMIICFYFDIESEQKLVQLFKCLPFYLTANGFSCADIAFGSTTNVYGLNENSKGKSDIKVCMAIPICALKSTNLCPTASTSSFSSVFISAVYNTLCIQWKGSQNG